MNVTPASVPPLSSPDPASQLSLEARILHAEQRLVAREQRMQQRLHSLGARAQAGLQPRRLAKPVLGGLAAVAGLWWLLRGRPGAAAQRQAAAAVDGHSSVDEPVPGAGLDLPWASLLGMAWPLLPARLRARLSPATVNLVLSLGVPLAQQLLSRGQAQPLDVAQPVDVSGLAGTWVEVARLPRAFEARSTGQARLRCVLQGDGSIALTRRCPAGDGQHEDTHGAARPVPGSAGAKWRVSLWPQALRWLPFAWSDQWVLQTDAACSELLIGSPDRSALVLLARRPGLAASRVQALVQTAQDRGYAVEKLRFNEPGAAREPGEQGQAAPSSPAA
jgi:apolipoprotein D and lipocalin family protein